MPSTLIVVTMLSECVLIGTTDRKSTSNVKTVLTYANPHGQHKEGPRRQGSCCTGRPRRRSR